MLGSIGYPEIIGLLILILIIFGAKKLPELGRSLGAGMREFKDGISGIAKEEPPTQTASKPEEENKEEPSA